MPESKSTEKNNRSFLGLGQETLSLLSEAVEAGVAGPLLELLIAHSLGNDPESIREFKRKAGHNHRQAKTAFELFYGSEGGNGALPFCANSLLSGNGALPVGKDPHGEPGPDWRPGLASYIYIYRSEGNDTKDVSYCLNDILCRSSSDVSPTVRQKKKSKPKLQLSIEHFIYLEKLRKQILANYPSSPVAASWSTRHKWRWAAELEKAVLAGASIEDLAAAGDWATADAFWKCIVVDFPTLWRNFAKIQGAMRLPSREKADKRARDDEHDKAMAAVRETERLMREYDERIEREKREAEELRRSN